MFSFPQFVVVLFSRDWDVGYASHCGWDRPLWSYKVCYKPSKITIFINLNTRFLCSQNHTGIFKGRGYRSRLWLQFLKDVATVKNGRFAREFSS